VQEDLESQHELYFLSQTLAAGLDRWISPNFLPEFLQHSVASSADYRSWTGCCVVRHPSRREEYCSSASFSSSTLNYITLNHPHFRSSFKGTSPRLSMAMMVEVDTQTNVWKWHW